MLWSTNAIESLNARYRRAVKAKGHFPTEQAAMKCLYLVTRYRHFNAACSVGKGPLALTARRYRAFKLSIALLEQSTVRISTS